MCFLCKLIYKIILLSNCDLFNYLYSMPPPLGSAYWLKIDISHFGKQNRRMSDDVYSFGINRFSVYMYAI